MTTPTGSYQAPTPVQDETFIAKLGIISVQKTIDQDSPENRRWLSQFTIGGHDYAVEGFAADFGRPRGIDTDIYLALQKLYVEAGCPKSREVRVTTYELIKMVHCVPSAALYKRTTESLHRLWRVAFIVKRAPLVQDTPWRARVWKSETLQLLEKIGYVSVGIDYNTTVIQPKQMLRIVFSEEVADSLRAGNTHHLDWDKFMMIKHPTGRALHRLLEAHRPEDGQLNVSIDDWAAQCGILSERPSKVLQTLDQAHTDLVQVGYLQKVDVTGRGKAKSITYVYRDPNAERAAEHTAHEEHLIARLREFKLKEAVAREWVTRAPDLIEPAMAYAARYIKEKKATSSPVKSPAGLLIDVLTHPEKYDVHGEDLLPPPRALQRSEPDYHATFEQEQQELAQASPAEQWAQKASGIKVLVGKLLSSRGFDALKADCLSGHVSAVDVAAELARRVTTPAKREYLERWERSNQPMLLPG